MIPRNASLARLHDETAGDGARKAIRSADPPVRAGHSSGTGGPGNVAVSAQYAAANGCVAVASASRRKAGMSCDVNGREATSAGTSMPDDASAATRIVGSVAT